MNRINAPHAPAVALGTGARSTVSARTPATLRARGLLAGDVARALGIGVQTLHFYEREGLIPAPPRSESGYRLYSPEIVERVVFIRKAQALGLPLSEIAEVLSLAAQGASPCGRVQTAMAQKLAEVDQRLRDLQGYRDELAALVGRGEDHPVPAEDAYLCAIVETAPPLPAVGAAATRRLHTSRTAR